MDIHNIAKGKKLRREKALACPSCGRPLIKAERWFGGQRFYRCECGEKHITYESFDDRKVPDVSDKT